MIDVFGSAFAFAKNFFINLLAQLAVMMTVFSPVLAHSQSITVDGSAPRSMQPTITQSGNGKPQINIVAPEAGVSQNRYKTLSTNSGVIFNNSTVGGRSRTGGTVVANPNLAKSGTAKVILNEVRGNTRSSLRGSLEVFGDKADVIIANENGITCDGCSFVNTNRATLSTGRATVRGSNVQLRVAKGDVRIERGGISGADVLNLSGRHVLVDGKVQANRSITVSGGAQYFDPATGRSSPAPTTARRNSPYAVDATAFGAMSSGTIRIIGNESGLGVRTQGTLSASRDVTIYSRGDADFGSIKAGNNIYVGSARTVRQVRGAAQAGNDVTLAGHALNILSGAKTIAGDEVRLRANTNITVAGEVRAKSVLVEAGYQVANLGSVVSRENISIVAGEIANRRAVKQTYKAYYAGYWARYVPYLQNYIRRYPASRWTPYYRSLLAQATYRKPDQQTLGATATIEGGNVSLVARTGSVTNESRLVSYKNMSIYAARDLVNRNQIERDLVSGSNYRTTYHSGYIWVGGSASLTAAKGSIANQSLIYARGDLSMLASTTIDSHVATAGRNLSITSGNSLTINNGYDFSGNFYARSLGGDLTVARTVNAPNAVTLLAGRDVNVKSNLTARNKIAVSAGRNANIAARLYSYADLSVAARGSINNSSYITARRDLVLEASGNIDSLYAYASRNLSVRSTGGSIVNRYYLGAGNYAGINAAHAVINQGYASGYSYLHAGRLLSVRAGTSIENRGGYIRSYGDLALSAGTTLLNTGVETRRSSTQYAGQRYATEYWTTTNTGTWRAGVIEARGDATLASSRGSIVNQGSSLTAGGDLVLSAAGNVTIGSKIYSDTITQRARRWYTYRTGWGWWRRTHWGYRDSVTQPAGTSRIANSVVDARNLSITAGATANFDRTNLSLDNLHIKAANATLSNQRTRVAGLADFEVTSHLNLQGGSISARDFDFNRTRLVTLNAEIDDLDSTDLILNFWNNVDNKANLRGRDIAVTSHWGWIRNSGTIVANRDVTLNALRDNVSYTDPNGASQSRNINSSDFTVISNSGSIRAGRQLLVDGYGNVEVSGVNAASVVVRSRNANVTFKGNLNARGDVTVTAGNDILNLGHTLYAAGLFSLFAGRDIKNEGQKRFFTLTSAHGCLGSACGRQGFTYSSTSIAAGEGLILNAGRDVINRGGELQGNDFVNITAGRDVVNEGLYGKYAYQDYYRTWTKKKWWGKRTYYVDKRYDERGVLKTSVIRSATGDVSISSGRDIYNVGALIQASGAVRLEADRNIILRSISVELLRDYYYSSNSSWFGIIKLGSTSSKSEWNQFAKIRSVIDGGSVEVLAADNIYVKAASVLSRGEADILAGDHIIVEPNTDRQYRRIENRSSGLFGWFRNDYSNVRETTVVNGSVLDANTDLTLVSATGDISLSASRLNAGRDITLSALNGTIYMNTALETAYEETETYSDNGIWYKTETSGSYTENVVHNQLLAGGEIRFRAGNGVVVSYRDNGDLNATLNTFARSPDLAWMAALRNDNRVQWNAVQAAAETWHYEDEGLTAPAAALLTIAVTVATSGTLSAVAGAITTNAVMQTALQAGMQSLVNRAAVSLVNNKGDLGAVLNELTSDAALRSLLTAMVTAGITTHLDLSVFAGLEGGQGFDPQLLSQQLVRDISYSAIKASVSTAIEGGDFGDQFVSNLRYAAASTLGKMLAEDIGAAYEAAREDNGLQAQEYFFHKMGHAVLGCAMGAIANGNCAAGAAGGLTGAVVAEGYQALTYDEFEAEAQRMLAFANGDGVITAAEEAAIQATFQEWRLRGVNLSRLSAAFMGAAIGEDANIGDLTGGNVAENNVLPAVLLIARIGLAAYTAYELYESGEAAVELYTKYRNDELTEDDWRAMAVELGIATVSGVVLSKVKVLDAMEQLARKAGFHQKADEILSSIARNFYGTRADGGLLWTSWSGYTKVSINGREYAHIGRRNYTRHAVDRMQPMALGTPVGADGPGRNITPNMVEYVIRSGQRSVTTRNGVRREVFTSGNVSVVTENNTRTIVTLLRN